MEMAQFNAVAQAIETMESVSAAVRQYRESFAFELDEAALDLKKAFPETGEEEHRKVWQNRADVAFVTLAPPEYQAWRLREDVKPYLERYAL